MKVGWKVLSVLALLLALPPAGAGAVELARDDGTFEWEEYLNPPGVTRAVDYDLPTAEVYDVTGVSIYMMNGWARDVPLTVSVWDALLNQVSSTQVTVHYQNAGWYDVDLTGAGIQVDGTLGGLRVGVAQNLFERVPFLGMDMQSPASGHTWQYANGYWQPTPMSFDAGIRVGVELAPPPEPVDEIEPLPPAGAVLACQGFGPPLHKPRMLRRGGRTLPLKAFLTGADGAAVGGDALVALPAVQVLYTPEGGAEAVDVTDLIGPAGSSNTGTSFRASEIGRWRYNLKTRGLEPGTYEILLVSGDETEYLVEPTCSAVITVGAPAGQALRSSRKQR